jgi:hypothetical protein
MSERAFRPERLGETWLCEHSNDRSLCEECKAGKRSNADLATELLKKYERKDERKKAGIESSPIILDEIIETVETDKLEGFIDTLNDASIQVSPVLERLRKAMDVEKRSSFIRIKGGDGSKTTERSSIEVFSDALMRLDPSDREEVAKVLKRLAA